MNTAAAVIANVGLLVTTIVYLLTTESIALEGREVPMFAFVFLAPVLSIVALLSNRRAPNAARRAPADPGSHGS